MRDYENSAMDFRNVGINKTLLSIVLDVNASLGTRPHDRPSLVDRIRKVLASVEEIGADERDAPFRAFLDEWFPELTDSNAEMNGADMVDHLSDAYESVGGEVVDYESESSEAPLKWFLVRGRMRESRAIGVFENEAIRQQGKDEEDALQRFFDNPEWESLGGLEVIEI